MHWIKNKTPLNICKFGRKKNELDKVSEDLILQIHKEQDLGARRLETIIEFTHGKHIPHNAIHMVLMAHGQANKNPKIDVPSFNLHSATFSCKIRSPISPFRARIDTRSTLRPVISCSLCSREMNLGRVGASQNSTKTSRSLRLCSLPCTNDPKSQRQRILYSSRSCGRYARRFCMI